MKNSHVHVVYVYRDNDPEPVVMGFGKSDQAALRDAIKNAATFTDTLRFFFIRSNGTHVPIQGR